MVTARPLSQFWNFQVHCRQILQPASHYPEPINLASNVETLHAKLAPANLKIVVAAPGVLDVYMSRLTRCAVNWEALCSIILVEHFCKKFLRLQPYRLLCRRTWWLFRQTRYV
jgi:hypothetical protein